MTTERRKAAIAAYKERKAAVGVYAVSCAPAGKLWSARPATSTRCGTAFLLAAHRRDPRRDLQAA